MLRGLIRQFFEEAVRLDTENSPELRAALLRGHPKLDAFLDHLTKQVQDADEKCKVKYNLTLQRGTIQDFVYELTALFMKGMEGEARRRYESDAQRSLREQQATKEKEFENFLEGGDDNEFAEEGVITDEDVNQAREEGNNEASIKEGFNVLREANI